MKKTKKLVGMVVVIALAANLLVGMTAFAADVNIFSPAVISGFNTSMSDADEVQVISLDVTIPEAAEAGYAFRFLNNDGEGTPYGNIRFRNTGNISANIKAADWAASWLENDNYNKKAYTLGQTHELILRFSKTTGNVDFYLDGKYFCRQTGTGSAWIYGVAVLSDETNVDDDGNFILPTVTLNYVTGLSDDELGAFLSDIDEENKTITVKFTEAVGGTFTNTKLKRVNGGTEIDLSNPVVSGNTLTYTYAEDLMTANEYVFTMPDDLRGTKYLYKLANNNFYFSTDSERIASESVDTFESESDESFQIHQAISPYSVMSERVSGGKDSDYAISVKGYESSGATMDMNWENFDNPTSDVYTISYDIKPLYDNMSTALRFLPENNGTPIMIGLSKTGTVLGGYAWDTAAIIEAGDNWWNNRLKIGTYSKDNWINLKFKWDETRKTGAFYVNDVYVKATTAGKDLEANATAYPGFSYARFYVYTSPLGINDDSSLFMMDNIKVQNIESPVVVSNVRFNDADGNSIGAYDTLDAALASVDVTFSDAMTLGETSENIKLYYGEDEVAYTGVYNADTKCYTMTPSVAADVPDKDYRVEVKGITTTSGATVEDYICSVATDVYTFIDASVEVVNASGQGVVEIAPGTTYTIKCSYESAASGVTSVPVLIAEYSENGTLTKIITENLSEDKDISYTIDVDAETYPSKVKVFAWSNMSGISPLCDAVELSVITQ